MHDYAYSSQLKGANLPLLDVRLAEFGVALADALQSDADEVLLVGSMIQQPAPDRGLGLRLQTKR